jgi:uncharacterized protein
MGPDTLPRRPAMLVRSPEVRYLQLMHFARDSLAGNTVRAYAAGQVTINDEIVRTSVVVTAERIIRDWLPERFGELAPGHLARLAELQPEIIVLGTGSHLRFPSAALTAGFLSQGIGVEIMDTDAACRTYNILLSEGRRVVAALLMT